MDGFQTCFLSPSSAVPEEASAEGGRGPLDPPGFHLEQPEVTASFVHGGCDRRRGRTRGRTSVRVVVCWPPTPPPQSGRGSGAELRAQLCSSWGGLRGVSAAPARVAGAV